MTRLLIALLALAPLAACSSDDSDHRATEAGTAEAGFGGPVQGEILETATSEGGEIAVGVTTEVMFLQLTPEARKEVAEEMDREVPEEGIGASLGRALTGIVNDALASTMQIPLEDVEGLRYDAGRLRFESDGVNVEIDEDGEDGIPMAEADAQRLIAAFERAR